MPARACSRTRSSSRTRLCGSTPVVGFIQQEDLRLVNDAAGEIEAPPHAAAELFDGLAGAVLETGGLEYFLHALAEQGIAHALRATPVIEVFDGGELFVK